MAKPISTSLRVVTRYNQNQSQTAKSPAATFSVADLKTMAVAKTVTEELPFPLTCMHTRSAVVFSAQLNNGKCIGIVPVMPRNPADPTQVLAPTNGESGYLTLEYSENAKITEETPGRLEFSIRPKFMAWESAEAREYRLAAEAAEAAKAKGSK